MLLKSQSNWFARTVFESEEVQTVVDAARLQYERFDNFWMGLTWLLARKGHELGGPPQVRNGVEYRLYKESGLQGDSPVPATTVIYTVGQNEIDIIGARLSELEDDEEDDLPF